MTGLRRILSRFWPRLTAEQAKILAKIKFPCC